MQVPRSLGARPAVQLLDGQWMGRLEMRQYDHTMSRISRGSRNSGLLATAFSAGGSSMIIASGSRAEAWLLSSTMATSEAALSGRARQRSSSDCIEDLPGRRTRSGTCRRVLVAIVGREKAKATITDYDAWSGASTWRKEQPGQPPYIVPCISGAIIWAHVCTPLYT